MGPGGDNQLRQQLAYGPAHALTRDAADNGIGLRFGVDRVGAVGVAQESMSMPGEEGAVRC